MSGSPGNSPQRQKATEQEREAVERQMLHAALQELGTLPPSWRWDDGSSRALSEIPRRVVCALAAATNVLSAENKRLSQIKRGAFFSAVEPAEVVAAAFWIATAQTEEITAELGLDTADFAAAFIGGCRLLMFAQGIAAATAAASAVELSAVQDLSPLSFIGEGATTMVESWRQ